MLMEVLASCLRILEGVTNFPIVDICWCTCLQSLFYEIFYFPTVRPYNIIPIDRTIFPPHPLFGSLNKVTFKHFLQHLRSHIISFRTLGGALENPLLCPAVQLNKPEPYDNLFLEKNKQREKKKKCLY
jgi:hypothetical protein